MRQMSTHQTPSIAALSTNTEAQTKMSEMPAEHDDIQPDVWQNGLQG